MAGSPHVLSGTFAGRYTIERELGHGATATVYLARDTQRGRAVAIKVLRTELAESVGAERFLREIKLNEQLQHPHIVHVLDSGEHEGQLYFVLPWMEDGSLRQMLERERQLPIEKAVAITRTVADALHYAHEKGLIHRDVKPENILFSSGQACLADFGIARAIERAIDASTTETGLVRGTPAYMSPEQASGSRQYDGRSDQYSLACVLYEVLAGMQAFIGPTAEMIIAQRFQHTPRELRIYRPSVPKSLEQVIVKALSLSPADRYESAAAFSAALEAAMRAPAIEPRTSGPTLGMTKSKRWAVVGALGFAAAVLAVVGTSVGRRFLRTTSQFDTTRVVVLPFDAATPTASTAAQEFLHSALRNWRGLTPVPLDQTAEGIRHIAATGAALSASQSRALASSLDAGRYVVGRVMRTPTGEALFAEYRDVESGALHAAQLELPVDSAKVLAVYAALADSLLLRGASDEGRPRAPGESRSLLAAQTFIRGLEARNQWKIPRAESLFLRTTEYEPSDGRAFLWLAQVRQWADKPADTWISAVERALSDTIHLSRTERGMAEALSALGKGDYAGARDKYRQLTAADARSFAGWYGLGESHRRDDIVVPDRRSPSGWRFRSSYEQAVRAYTRAFEVIPATYEGFETDGYAKLRSLLFTSSNRFHRGASQGNPAIFFLAAPTLSGDTIVMIPRRRDLVLSGREPLMTSLAAVERLRATLSRIALRWATAFPTSASAKETLALSLELQGDRSALDTMRAAERLASDVDQRGRLAASRISLQVKYAIPDSTRDVESAVASTDSLLRASTSPSPAVSGFLAPLAAMMGRCKAASDLLRRAAVAQTAGDIQIAQSLAADANAVQGYPLSGCSVPSGMPTANDLAARLVVGPNAEARRPMLEYVLLGTLVRASGPADSAWVVKFADIGGNVFAAQRDALIGHIADARTRLESMARIRERGLPGEVTADVILPEAKIWLQIGDTTAAITALESIVRTTRFAPPLSAGNALYNAARLGALTQVLALHARLSVVRNPQRARQSARAALALWSKADADLRPLISDLKTIAR